MAGGRTQGREVKSGSSYLGQSDLRVHFGLGTATRVEKLEIRWPGGRAEAVTAPPVNQVVIVQEGKGVIKQIPFRQGRTATGVF